MYFNVELTGASLARISQSSGCYARSLAIGIVELLHLKKFEDCSPDQLIMLGHDEYYLIYLCYKKEKAYDNLRAIKPYSVPVGPLYIASSVYTLFAILEETISCQSWVVYKFLYYRHSS